MSTLFSTLTPSGTPLYIQVKRAVLEAMAAGEFKQGEAIPPEKQLAERFGVSIGTLRKAVDELAAENILVRHQGRGTFITGHDYNAHTFRFFRIVRRDGLKTYPTMELMRFKRIRASEEARNHLLLDPGSYVFEFVNRLTLNDEKVIIDTTSLPEARFIGLNGDMLRDRPSTIYSLFQQAFGVNVIATSEKVRTAQANDEHARWLNIDVGTPLLEIDRIAYSYNKLPVEWRVSRLYAENYDYVGQEHPDTE